MVTAKEAIGETSCERGRSRAPPCDQWTRAGHFAPEHHDFTYEEAAEHFAGILRDNGHHHVTTHHLTEPDSTEPRRNQS